MASILDQIWRIVGAKPASTPKPTQVKSSVTRGPIQGPGLGYHGDVAKFTPQGQFTGVTNYAGGGSSGGGGGGGGGGSSSNAGSDTYESVPGQPDFEGMYGNAFSQAYGALDQAESGYNQQFAADQADIGLQADTQKQGINTTLATQQRNLDKQTEREQLNSESAVNEQRRQFSEMAQGLQARYGGSTGTGAFAETQLGNQVLRAIGENRQTLARTLTDIGDTRNQIYGEAQRQLLEIDRRKDIALQQAKAQLNQNLAEIRGKKGQLAIERTSQMTNAIQNYQALVSSINARNTAWKQQLFTDARDFERQIQARQTAAYKDNIGEYEKRLEGLLKAGVLSDSGLRTAERAMGLVGGSLQNSSDNMSEDEKRMQMIERLRNGQ